MHCAVDGYIEMRRNQRHCWRQDPRSTAHGVALNSVHKFARAKCWSARISRNGPA